MLIQIFSLVLHFATGLVAGTCLLRMYMHLMGINLSRSGGNPLAPFIFTITNWIVLPVRRFVPALGRLDTASLVAAYAVLLAKHSLLWIVAGASSDWLGLFINAGFEMLSVILSSLMWMVIGYALMSWFSAAAEIRYFLAQLIEPLLIPIRRVLPQMGGVDLSPIALLLLIQIAEIVLHGLRAQVVLYTRQKEAFMLLKRPWLVIGLAAATLQLASLKVAAQTAATPATLPAVATIAVLDVPRYMGTWYEIAKFPNRFQAKCVANTRAQYLAQTDGSVQVLNSCTTTDGSTIDALGKAIQVGAATSPKLQVRFAPAWLSWLPMVWGDYWVIDLDTDYQLAAVSDAKREYLWVLSRTPQTNAKAYEALLDRLKAQHFDVKKLEPTPQR
jgi:apolipoprotein D and lipocalin family protein